MNRSTGLKSDLMQYRAVPGSARHSGFPASDIPQSDPAVAQAPAVTPLSAYDTPLQYATGLAYADMTRSQKYIFVTKLIVCIATFGFVFPNVQND